MAQWAQSLPSRLKQSSREKSKLISTEGCQDGEKYPSIKDCCRCRLKISSSFRSNSHQTNFCAD